MSGGHLFGSADADPSGSHKTATWDPAQCLWTTETQLASRHNVFPNVQGYGQPFPTAQQIPQTNPLSLWSPASAQMLASISFVNTFDAELQQLANDQPSQPSFQHYIDFSSLVDPTSNLYIDMEMMRIDDIVHPFASATEPFSLPTTTSPRSDATPVLNNSSNVASFCLPPSSSNTEHGTIFPTLVPKIQPTLSQSPASATLQSPTSSIQPSSSSTPRTTSLSSPLPTHSPSSIPCPFPDCQRTFSQRHECK